MIPQLCRPDDGHGFTDMHLPQAYWIAHIKYVRNVAYQLYLNRVVLKIKSREHNKELT